MKDPSNPDNEGKVFLFKYGKKIYDKIMDAVNGDELEGREGYNPFDFWTGANFKLRSKKVAGYPNYDSSEFESPPLLRTLTTLNLRVSGSVSLLSNLLWHLTNSNRLINFRQD